MQHVIITHTDADGWASATVVLMYLNEKYPGAQVQCFSYNYGTPTTIIEKYLNENNDKDFYIWMTDITLPDEFMNKYAQYIHHLDHHASRLEEKQSYTDKLRKEDSAITVEGYKDLSGKQAEQVAACELCWLKLFGDREMPKVIRLIGRYDVWDHNDEVLNLNAYINSRLPSLSHNDQRYLQPWFKNLFTEKGLSEALEEGEKALWWSNRFNAINCVRNSKTVKMFGRTIALCNYPGGSSKFFDYLVNQNRDIEGLMTFYYSITRNNWKISCYTREGAKDFKALDFIDNFKEKIKNIITSGGHEDACGMTISADSINDFLKCIDEVIK